MDYVLDTNFLIGLWRQRSRGPEAAYLASHPDAGLAVPWIAKAEFLAGAVIAGHDLEGVSGFLANFPVVWPGEATLMCYAELTAQLRQKRQAVGPNDLWIAAAAVERDIPLLTRNIKELSRVDRLNVVDYAKV